MKSPFDAGLQPERTELAWRRTCLALGVGSLVALRVLPLMFGSALWALGGAVGILLASGLWIASRYRYRAMHAVLHTHGDRGRMPDGKLPFILAVASSIVGITTVAMTIAIMMGVAKTILGGL